MDGVPVDARQVLGPELLPLEPPRLLEHLPPLRHGLDRDLDPVQVDPSALAPWGIVLGRLLARPQDPKPPAGAVEDGPGIATDQEILDPLDQALLPMGLEVVALDR